MSPKNKIKLNILRKKLDLVDNNLLKILKIRSNLVKDVLKLKKYKKEIIDKNIKENPYIIGDPKQGDSRE